MGSASMAPRSRRNRWREFPLAMGMLLPSFVVLGAFVVYPFVRTISLGRQRCNSFGRCRTTGWDQYLDTFTSEQFRQSLVVTFKFAAITVPLGLVLGVALAVLADRHLRGIGVFRAIFSSTIATSVAVASLMWLFLFQPSVGVLANVGWLRDLVPSIKDPGWLNDPGTALTAVSLSSIWGNLGFTFIVVTAALQSVPGELYEAAAVDGASRTRRFWAITVPLLYPVLLFVVVVLTTRAFQAYAEVDLLTDGGPQPQASTTTLTYFIYGSSSPIRSDPGLQATSAVLLFVVLLLLAALQLRSLGRRFQG